MHARVDELDIHQIREGQTAAVRILILPKSALPAVVTEVGSQLDGNGLPEIPIVLRLTGKDNMDLRQKLTAEARIFTEKNRTHFIRSIDTLLPIMTEILMSPGFKCHGWPAKEAARAARPKPILTVLKL